MEKPSFWGLFGHYLSGSGDEVEIDVNELETDPWRDALQRSANFQRQLKAAQARRSPDPVFVKIPNVLVEPLPVQNDFYGIGRYKLDFTGHLNAHDHTWRFNGDVTGSEDPKYGKGVDRYDFEQRGDRSTFGEITTTVGREIGKPFGAKGYNVKIKNYRRYQQSGDY
jgi:hypothetical protein